jgi:hypothetical protein
MASALPIRASSGVWLGRQIDQVLDRTALNPIASMLKEIVNAVSIYDLSFRHF